MKEIIAIIRPQKWAATKRKLEEVGVMASTGHRVYGRGKQSGLRYLNPGAREAVGIPYIPKRLIYIFAMDADVKKIVDAIIAVNQTPAIGDGKIFICPVEESARIRTKESGQIALS